jgi:hypothetical protein
MGAEANAAHQREQRPDSPEADAVLPSFKLQPCAIRRNIHAHTHLVDVRLMLRGQPVSGGAELGLAGGDVPSWPVMTVNDSTKVVRFAQQRFGAALLSDTNGESCLVPWRPLAFPSVRCS